MALLFRSLLEDAGLDPKQVSMLRHRPRGGLFDPFSAWRTDRVAFDDYQSIQKQQNRSRFRRPIWAAFASTPGAKTLFLGLYDSALIGPVGAAEQELLTGDMLNPTIHDRYRCTPKAELSEYGGRLFIDWGNAHRQWVQHGEASKPISELYDVYKDPVFPGHIQFIEPLSAVPTLPPSWTDILRNSKGIYLLTCPNTKEQYVGKADGEGGFWGRWLSYVATGDGGNVRLKSREPSDYQVSILEVAGSAATPADILKMESLWKAKLQTIKMGLNGN
jgi:hypothetical protein